MDKRDLMSSTLKELGEDEFNRFKFFLRRPFCLEGLQPIPKETLRRYANSTGICAHLIHHYGDDAAQIMFNVLQEMKFKRKDLLQRFLNLPNIYQNPITDTVEERILKTLCGMTIRKFVEFRSFLRGLEGFEGKKELENANRIDTAELILETYPDDPWQIVENGCQKINWTLDSRPDELEGPKEKKRKINKAELRDDPGASTSTTPHDPGASTSIIPHDPGASTSIIPRKWFPVSKRWRPQLEKLVSMDVRKVKEVESLVFGKGTEFRIGEGSNGVEVFLGLRNDGTEVAVKRMSKTHNLYTHLKNDELYLRLPELDDPSIVRYVDFVEDEDYGYLALQLCEYTLDKYIAKLPEQGRKRLAKQFLSSLRILHGQDSKILHRDINPQNVLIDIQGKARLSDFGISRRIDEGQTTRHTGVAGTPCWMAKETLKKSDAGYKRSTDIQVAGMLTYYILSGGHHPFLEDTKNGEIWECQQNISECNYHLKHVELADHMVAEDLVEWMIHGVPKERPKVEQCLAHPFFWPNTWRTEYLRRIGNEKEVEKYQAEENKAKDEEEKQLIRSLKVLIPALDQYAEQGQFNAWKQKFREANEETRQLFEVMDGHYMKKGPDGKKKKFYSENSFGLLRFIRNLHAHYPEAAARINLMEMFPDLFWYVYKFAKDQEPDWNSRPALKDMFDFCPRCALTS